MAIPPKTPPRFVPTLTEVVQTPDAPAPPVSTTMTNAPLQRASVASASASVPLPIRQTAHPTQSPVAPHRRTTTSPAPAPELALAPIKTPQPVAPSVSAPWRADALPVNTNQGTVPAKNPLNRTPEPELGSRRNEPASPTLTTPQIPEGMEEYMVHRVMQRVDVVLDQRLRDAIATVVQEQTRSVLPRLREEIESVVRHAVYEAVADELASGAALPGKR